MELRTQIIQLVEKEQDEHVLAAIHTLLRKITEPNDEDISDEELAELEKLRDQRLKGEGRIYSMEEAMKIARDRVKK
ncbi:MAG: hypothetical protein M3R08_10310 [Bacteroidota bacterium]|nr:hypothetical protein [Bacteroidota bacterium]